jgi:hypothetical protein
MQAIIAFLVSGTGRRLVVLVVGAAVPVLNAKFGWGLDSTAITADALMVVGYIAASNAKEASDNHADAKVQVATLNAAPDAKPTPPVAP